MRRFLYAVLLIASLTSVGCASWINDLRSNPIAALTTAVNYFQTAITLARGAVGVYATAAGDTNVASRFEQLASNVENGLVVAQDGLRVAADAGTTPDVSALLTDAKQSMAHVHEFLAGLSTTSHAASSSQMRSALHATAQAAGIRETSP